MCFMRIVGVVVFTLQFCFLLISGDLGGFASVGSRNALHVVGVTPVLHVVRSCTTVMAMGISGIIGNNSCCKWVAWVVGSIIIDFIIGFYNS